MLSTDSYYLMLSRREAVQAKAGERRVTFRGFFCSRWAGLGSTPLSCKPQVFSSCPLECRAVMAVKICFESTEQGLYDKGCIAREQDKLVSGKRRGLR